MTTRNQPKRPRAKIDHYIVTCKGKPCGLYGKILTTNTSPAAKFYASRDAKPENRTSSARKMADRFIRRTTKFCEELRSSLLFDWPMFSVVRDAGWDDFKLVPVKVGADNLPI